MDNGENNVIRMIIKYLCISILTGRIIAHTKLLQKINQETLSLFVYGNAKKLLPILWKMNYLVLEDLRFKVFANPTTRGTLIKQNVNQIHLVVKNLVVELLVMCIPADLKQLIKSNYATGYFSQDGTISDVYTLKC